MSFIQSVGNSSKCVMRKVLAMITYDVGSVTGYNLREIMLCKGLQCIDQLHPDMRQNPYQHIPLGCEDNVRLVEELLLVKQGEYQIPGFDENTSDQMLTDICRS